MSAIEREAGVVVVERNFFPRHCDVAGRAIGSELSTVLFVLVARRALVWRPGKQRGFRRAMTLPTGGLLVRGIQWELCRGMIEGARRLPPLVGVACFA